MSFKWSGLLVDTAKCHLLNSTSTREEEAVELRSQLSRLENLLAIMSAPKGTESGSGTLSDDESGGQSGALRRHDSERESAAQALESLSVS